MKALEALADPTRRTIVELLAERELSAGELAARFETQTYGYLMLLTGKYPSFNVGIEE